MLVPLSPKLKLTHGVVPTVEAPRPSHPLVKPGGDLLVGTISRFQG